MTVVYVDLLFLLNLVTNYLLLLGSGRVVGAALKRIRIALAAGFGAIYAVMIFLPGMTWLALLPIKLSSGVLMVLIAYGGERRMVRAAVAFLAASAGLAGMVLAIELLGGTSLLLENGVLYSEIDLRLLLLIAIICYCILSLFFRRTGSHARHEFVTLKVELLYGFTEVTALLDTGHSLADPVTNQPVVVVDTAAIAHLIPVKIDPANPVEGVKKCRLAGINGVRLIPYRAVGTDCGILLAMQSKSVTIGERRLGALLIALAPNRLDGGEGYQAIIGGI